MTGTALHCWVPGVISCFLGLSPPSHSGFLGPGLCLQLLWPYYWMFTWIETRNGCDFWCQTQPSGQASHSIPCSWGSTPRVTSVQWVGSAAGSKSSSPLHFVCASEHAGCTTLMFSPQMINKIPLTWSPIPGSEALFHPIRYWLILKLLNS